MSLIQFLSKVVKVSLGSFDFYKLVAAFSTSYLIRVHNAINIRSGLLGFLAKQKRRPSVLSTNVFLFTENSP